MPVKLGELLLKENMVSPQQLQDALNHQRMSGGRLGKAIVSLGFLKEEEITSLLSRQFGVPSIDLEHLEVDPAIIKVIPPEVARKYQVLPLHRQDKTLTIAMADPTNVLAIDDIRFMTGHRVLVVVAGESALEDAIERHYGSIRSRVRRQDGAHASAAGDGGEEAPGGPTLSIEDMASLGGLSELDLDSMGEVDARLETARPDDDEIDLGNLARSADASPVVKLMHVILVDSLKRGASDIHFEPYEKEFRIRFRIDGILYNMMALPMKLRDPLGARIKTMARLKIAEKRLPQDGRIRIVMRVEDKSREIDFRVSLRPTLWGETIALRLRDRSKSLLDLARLGFEPSSAERFRSALSRRSGIVLVSGPQRSGKTNTLHAAIATLNKPEVGIVTVEDPVELVLPGVNQVQIDRAVGESPASALRSLLHADADVIALSEIADCETADIAVRLAQQGHLVLSTLPASDAASTLLGLLHLGVDPYLLATTVNLVQAQRLVRRICPNCSVDDTAGVPSTTLVDLGFTRREVGTLRLMKGRGCTACNGTGYKGRVGLFETMEVTDWIRDLILAGAGAAELRDKAIEEGMLTLRMSGLEKIRKGVTTVEEVARETVPGRGTSLPEEKAAAVASAASELAAARAEIDTLRRRLKEEDGSSALAAQLDDAKAEIENLRQELFRLHSYRTAYERRKAGDAVRPGDDPKAGT